ncbi:MAG: MFS transporter, partial [Chloroflexota bacterium]
IIWLQGIWLPLHGYSFAETPLWAGIYMLPMMFGFLIAGPISGWLSDRYGARPFSTGGMVIAGITFVLLTFLPADFSYTPFAILLLVNGIGMGLFSSPNTSSIMSSVPPEHRGVASGMRATLMNSGMLFSMSIFFTIVIVGLSSRLPAALFSGLTHAGLPAAAARQIAHLPPTAALFSAFLGYNPMAHLLPASVLAHLPAAARVHLLGHAFFPSLIAPPFMDGLRDAFYVSAVMAGIAAVASLLRGKQFIYGASTPAEPAGPPFGADVGADVAEEEEWRTVTAGESSPNGHTAEEVSAIRDGH